mgnify:CR=1 FL=1
MRARSLGFRRAGPGGALSGALIAALRCAGVVRDMRYAALPVGSGVALERERAIMCGLSVQQGPNYALAKLLQRWRALVARDDGSVVSLTCGPPAKTDSVMASSTIRFIMSRIERVAPNICADPGTVQALMSMVRLR